MSSVTSAEPTLRRARTRKRSPVPRDTFRRCLAGDRRYA